MTNSDRTPFLPNFPNSVLTVSREEFYGQDDQHRPLTLKVMEGTLPDGIHGHAFIIGPAGSLDSQHLGDPLLIRPSGDGTPLFNGDAMIYRLDFDEVIAVGRDVAQRENDDNVEVREVQLTTRLAKTPCFFADLATITETEYKDLRFDNYGFGRLSTALGFRNEVNTAFLAMKFPEQNERLLITWDAGRPYEIDPVSLEIVTPVGWNREWREQIQFDPPSNIPFGIATTAAHPCFDPYTNEVFTINYGKSVLTVLSPSIISDLEAPLESGKDFLQAVEDLVEKVVISQGLPKAPDDIIKTVNGEGKLDRDSFPFDLDLPGKIKFLWEESKTILEVGRQKGVAGLKDSWEELQKILKRAKSFLDAAHKLEDFVYLIRWDGIGDLKKWEVVLEDGPVKKPVKIQQSMHQIGLTEDYILLMDTAFKQSAEQILRSPFPDHPQIERLWRILIDYNELPNTNLYIVRRADLVPDKNTVVARKVVIPRESAHFVADYKNPDNRITLHLAHNSAWDPAEWSHDYDQSVYNSPDHRYGMSVGGMDINHLGRYLIDAKRGKLCESSIVTNAKYTWATAIFAYRAHNPSGMPLDRIENIYWNCWGCWKELMTKYIVDKYKDYKYREIPVEEVLQIAEKGIGTNLCRLDTREMKIADVYEFPSGYFGNSPQFVPRADGNDDSMDGYLVCVVNKGNKIEPSEIWIFDAADLAQGPLCKLSHPKLHLGMTIHTTWLANIAPHTASYYIPVEEDYKERVNQKSQAVQKLFETKVYPHFSKPKAQPGIV